MGVTDCIKSAKLDGSKQNVENVAGCAADAYCATYGIPPGLCSEVAGPVVGAVYDFFAGLFGGPSWDCSKYSPIMIEGKPSPPCGPCATMWYVDKYGPNGALKASQDCGAYKRDAQTIGARQALALLVANNAWVDFEHRFAAAVYALLDAVPGAYAGWQCDGGEAPPSALPSWKSATAKVGKVGGCSPTLSPFGNAIWHKFRQAVVTSSGAPGLDSLKRPLYTAADGYMNINTNAADAADQILRMGANLARVTKQFMAVYAPSKAGSTPPPPHKVPAWAWVALAGGAGALGYAAWKRRRHAT